MKTANCLWVTVFIAVAGCQSYIQPKPADAPTWASAHVQEKHLADAGIWAITDDARIVRLRDAEKDETDWRRLCERSWSPDKSPLVRPVIREKDRWALKNPNFISGIWHKVPWNIAKIMYTCEGGAFGEIDASSTKTEFFGIVEGNPCGITQLKDTVFVLACPGKDRLTFVDALAHPFRSENQKRWHYRFSGASGCDWDQPRQVLWAIGDRGLVAFRYNLLTDRTIEPLYGYDWSAYGTRARDFHLWNDGKIRFTTEKGVVVFDPDAETFEILADTTGVSAFAPSSKGDLRFFAADGSILRGGKKLPTSTLKVKAATLLPVGQRDFGTGG